MLFWWDNERQKRFEDVVLYNKSTLAQLQAVLMAAPNVNATIRGFYAALHIMDNQLDDTARAMIHLLYNHDMNKAHWHAALLYAVGQQMPSTVKFLMQISDQFKVTARTLSEALLMIPYSVKFTDINSQILKSLMSSRTRPPFKRYLQRAFWAAVSAGDVECIRFLLVGDHGIDTNKTIEKHSSQAFQYYHSGFRQLPKDLKPLDLVVRYQSILRLPKKSKVQSTVAELLLENDANPDPRRSFWNRWSYSPLIALCFYGLYDMEEFTDTAAALLEAGANYKSYHGLPSFASFVSLLEDNDTRTKLQNLIEKIEKVVQRQD